MPLHREALPWWAAAADAVAIALLLVAVYVALEGGFVVEFGWTRLSGRSAWRVALWASILLLLRHFLIRDLPLHRRLTAPVSRIAGLIPAGGPLASDVPPTEGHPSSATTRRSRWLWGAAVVAVFTLLTAFM